MVSLVDASQRIGRFGSGTRRPSRVPAALYGVYVSDRNCAPDKLKFQPASQPVEEIYCF